ncbi:LacI family DNA-binding transcriptional regulator [Bifidobacterium tibiigranuli]|jgi:LacI family sucrose operon transcriptional repressor|uniref:LacI family DNA-binding transcriptional regulator n=1 Tax=Bifidobacterium tibiigranuli TaxID=2172043 RepID=A0A5N6S5Q8_9BIFI|nr:LacI family DNA-binding transcriptional regulator [Bifidobacterium tibiigranuli]KAE8129551.1 LacI family DNA-binding transcriptional regulator [Bifidobacterium tibiigranuli]KAE8129915.1 LacI family transcriptional regulator [Bifidobacterium tibiigranuli]MCI1212328.1 LacI family DNA-binding transcriptional regulator [Bifidobacterium tibiigranuli]MCI1221964.1 LacI family DNA-binding transcriptional regulator [Bifidobacterium tibiigranuli]MCI1232836.1 LacI family DNA-binding transcriptional re
MVGMRDVAKEAGVSLSTVSLVVNDTGYVSDDMRERVAVAMKKLDYIPNELARNFYRDRTNMIGVIVPTISHPFFSTLAAALQHELAGRGYRTLLCSQADAEGGEAEYVDMLQRHMMDGIIMAAHTSHAPDYWTLIGRPVVAFDRYLGAGIPSICSDHVHGGQLIAQQLIRTGARHVVSIGGPRSQFHDLPSQGARSDASIDSDGVNTTFPTVRYYLTLEHELGRAAIRYDYVEVGEVYDVQGYPRIAHEIFERFPDVDAIVGSDISAAYCVQEALRRGARIPDELQIIAYDGSYLTEAAGMRITAIRQDFATIAKLTSERIIEEIGKGEKGAAGKGARGSAPSQSSSAARRDPAGPAFTSTGEGDGHTGTYPQSELVPVQLRFGETTRA